MSVKIYPNFSISRQKLNYYSHYYFLYVKLIGSLALSIFFLFIFSDKPFFSIILVNILFCTYFVILFKNKSSYIFFLHSLLLIISSQLFTTPFLEAGDGESYQAVVSQYFNTHYLIFDASNLMATYDLLGFFKYTSLGVVPIYAIPEFFFKNPEDIVYYVWQGTFHVIMCAIVVTLAQSWRVLNGKYLFSIALFTVVSPSFFDLGAAPTRHVVTFFGVFLLFITHLAVVQKFTIVRAIWFSIAVLTVLISKAPLLLPYMIFVIIDIIFIKQSKLNAKSLFIFGIFMIGFILMGGYFYNAILMYAETSIGGAATFSGLTQIPIIGWFVKYVYALLAPFPWSEASHFIVNNYAGNWLLFLMHVLSSLIGLYLFTIIVFKWRSIFASNIELKRMVTFGLIMSLSILKGSTGFHTYLLIYFPMLAPLLADRRFLINPLIPICFVFFLELIVVVYR